MGLLALFEVVSGFVLWLILPRGGGGFMGGRGVVTQPIFLGDRQTWIDLHNWVAVALLVMVVIHVVLHWKWLVNITKRFGREAE
jgi:uncharacterized iron-regulated membrane protein